MDAQVGIIGAGPAGIAAGVQLKRFNIPSIIFEKREVGGLIANAYRVDNTLLFPEGISGKEFARRLKNYAERYKLEIHIEKAVRIEADEEIKVKTDMNEYSFKYLIVATGTRPKTLPFSGFRYHITDIKEKYEKILIVGGGDIALDYALSAAEKCSNVIVLYRSTLKALPALQKEVKENPRINLVRGEILDVSGKKAKTTAGMLTADVFLGAIGRIPNIEIVKGIVHPNIYLAGDVKNGIYRQSSLAIADGIRIAMEIWRRERYGNP